MPWARLEGLAFAAGFGSGHLDTRHGGNRPADVPGLPWLGTGGRPVTANLVEPDARSIAVSQLEALASDLGGRGFGTCISHHGGTLSLSVINRAAPGSGETIAAAPAADDTWWFLWSCGHRVARIADVEAAAFKIAYVLTLRAGG